jgi:hypothetical protein
LCVFLDSGYEAFAKQGGEGPETLSPSSAGDPRTESGGLGVRFSPSYLGRLRTLVRE